MSITLPQADLSMLSTNNTGSIDLKSSLGLTGVPDRNPVLKVPDGTTSVPVIRLHNESSKGLKITMSLSGVSFNLPAGGWNDCYPAVGETAVDYQVIYVIPNPSVSLLLATYYKPGEFVPSMTTLGNSSVGISGGGVTLTGSTLINTGNAPSASNIIQINNTASALDVTTLDNQGNLVNGNPTTPGTFKQYGPSQLDNGAIQTDGSGNIISGEINGAYISNNGNASRVALGSGAASASDVMDQPGADLYLKTGASTGGIFHFQSPNGTNQWNRGQERLISGTGSGSHSTGASAVRAIGIDACTTSGSTQTIGMTMATTTQVTTGSGFSWSAIVIN